MKNLVFGLVLFCFLEAPTFALDQIVRPYQSVRSAAMGGARMTTGLYDDNFFNNPARVTANTDSRFTLFEVMAEGNPTFFSEASQDLGGSNPLTSLANNEGNNLHARVQTVFPAYYLACSEKRNWALAVALITSTQTDFDLRQSYQMNLGALSDIGPAITFGRKFLKNESLSIGVTGHLMYRVATDPDYSLLDYVSGVPLTGSSIAGEGLMANADIGATYVITRWKHFDISVGGAIQNLLGGNYINFSPQGNGPPPQLRSYGIGVAAFRPVWWKFKNTALALEFTDLLNNTNGSIFRLTHLGFETHWKSIAMRLGLNQGYMTGGVGIDARYFTFNFTTYGEEMSLNSGGLEDRRYAFDIGFHI